MVFQRVAEFFGSVAVTMTEEIDEERPVTGEGRVGDDWRKVRGGCTAQSMKPDQWQVVSRELQVPKVPPWWLQQKAVHRALPHVSKRGSGYQEGSPLVGLAVVVVGSSNGDVVEPVTVDVPG